MLSSSLLALAMTVSNSYFHPAFPMTPRRSPTSQKTPYSSEQAGGLKKRPVYRAATPVRVFLPSLVWARLAVPRKQVPLKPRMPRLSAAPPVPRPDTSHTLSPLLSSLRVARSLPPPHWKVPRSVPTRTPNIVLHRSPPSPQSACVPRTRQQPSVLIECASSWLPGRARGISSTPPPPTFSRSGSRKSPSRRPVLSALRCGSGTKKNLVQTDSAASPELGRARAIHRDWLNSATVPMARASTSLSWARASRLIRVDSR